MDEKYFLQILARSENNDPSDTDEFQEWVEERFQLNQEFDLGECLRQDFAIVRSDFPSLTFRVKAVEPLGLIYEMVDADQGDEEEFLECNWTLTCNEANTEMLTQALQLAFPTVQFQLILTDIK